MPSLLEVLLDRASRAEPAAPPLPASLEPFIPSDEMPDPDAREAPPEIIFFGESLGIDYRDADGQASRRRITVHWVEERPGDLLVHSYCQERRAPRCFRVSRINAIIDLQTGEIVTAATEIQRQFSALTVSGAVSPAHATEAALRALRPGVSVLIFIARCDGHEHPSERDVILDYLDAICPAPGIDLIYANRCLDRLHPDIDTFDRAVRFLDRKDRAELRRVARHVRRLIDADHVLSETEALFAGELAAALT